MKSPPVTSTWRRPTAERWLATWAHEPVLVAESLRRLPEPVTALLSPPSAGTADAVVRRIATALLPQAVPDQPPAWLRPAQVPAFARAAAAVRQYQGALLAEAVGTGKSWIAVAVAGVVDARPPLILAPAAISDQWRRVLAEAGVGGTVMTHEAISRGRRPPPEHGLVIVDESHWFRNPNTRRYRTLAPWLVGQRGLLVTATPVVNSAADLGHQLRLFLRDDALAAAGLASLRGLREDRPGIPALAEVVVTGWVDGSARPALRRSVERPRCGRRMAAVLRDLDRLHLSADPAIAALIRMTFQGAAASSPAALDAALRRYLILLDHAADAEAAGRGLGREALRRFVAADPGQFVLWSLLSDDGPEGPPVDLADRATVQALRTRTARLAARADAKAAGLARLVADHRVTVVFTSSVATVGYLRRALDPDQVAWCTGSAAGIGSTRLPRATVLGWFGPRRGDMAPRVLRRPRVLVSTDVAAEGLDLQAAERIVHYDLPWTAIRTDQRAGRLRRFHSPHGEVLEHWLLPPPRLARQLGIEQLLVRKRGLPAHLGVDESARAPWRRRIAVARALAGRPASEGVAAIITPPAAAADAVACVTIEFPGRPAVARLLVHDPRRGWRGDEPTSLDFLEAAATAAPAPAPTRAIVDALVDGLAVPVREAMRQATGTVWAPGWQTNGSLIVLRRLRHWARIAARARDSRLLQRLDAAVRGLGRGQTAGEEVLVAELAARMDASLLEHLRAVPAPGPDLVLPSVRLVGMVVAGKG